MSITEMPTIQGKLETPGIIKFYGPTLKINAEIIARLIFAPRTALSCGPNAMIEAPEGVFLAQSFLQDVTQCNFNENTQVYYLGDHGYCDTYQDLGLTEAETDQFDAILVCGLQSLVAELIAD
jgi:hypothetical protein